jgi:hypothetical protein
MPEKPAAGDESLKRLGGGRWQTRDERFTIEPESGTWVVVDGEQTDDLGLPLVRGPFASLTAAKAAIGVARTSAPATSPLAGRLAGGEAKPPSRSAQSARRPAGPKQARSEPAAPAAEPEDKKRRPERAEPPRGKEIRPEPDWIADLAAGDRGRARRLIATLTAAGIPDAEGIVRRDLAGDVASVAAVAVARRIAALGDDADPRAVATAVAEGRDDELGVRWRLVDGDGRPILLEGPARRRAR